MQDGQNVIGSFVIVDRARSYFRCHRGNGAWGSWQVVRRAHPQSKLLKSVCAALGSMNPWVPGSY
jgi:hypothetical protein